MGREGISIGADYLVARQRLAPSVGAWFVVYATTKRCNFTPSHPRGAGHEKRRRPKHPFQHIKKVSGASLDWHSYATASASSWTFAMTPGRFGSSRQRLSQVSHWIRAARCSRIHPEVPLQRCCADLYEDLQLIKINMSLNSFVHSAIHALRRGELFGVRAARKGKRPQAKCLWPLKFLAEWTGLEPATPGMTGTYSRIAANGGERKSVLNQELSRESCSPPFAEIRAQPRSGLPLGLPLKPRLTEDARSRPAAQGQLNCT